MAALMEEEGYILVVSDKKEALDLTRSSLSGSYRRIIPAPNLYEAKKRASEGKIFLLIIFSPLTDGTGAAEAIELADRKKIPSILIVPPEIYPETAYRARNRRIYVLAHPARKGLLLQTVNILYESQRQLFKLIRERDQLKEKLTDLSLINRAKLLLMEKKGMTEEEAHHELEKNAMDAGITKRKAAEYLIARLSSDVR